MPGGKLPICFERWSSPFQLFGGILDSAASTLKFLIISMISSTWRVRIDTVDDVPNWDFIGGQTLLGVMFMSVAMPVRLFLMQKMMDVILLLFLWTWRSCELGNFACQFCILIPLKSAFKHPQQNNYHTKDSFKHAILISIPPFPGSCPRPLDIECLCPKEHGCELWRSKILQQPQHARRRC